MASKLSSSFDDLLDENRKQMNGLFGEDRKPARPTSAPTLTTASAPAPQQPPSSAPEPAPSAPKSGQISGTAKGIPFSLKVSG